MRTRTLMAEMWLPRPVEEVFAFFGSVHNLDAITPPWLHFRIVRAPEGELRAGSLIEYRIRWRWLPLAWQAEITAWEPPHRFVDVQRRGPYRLWVHEHRFQPERGGTKATDRVEYAIPGGPLEPLLHGILVGPDLARIFAYRERQLKQRLHGTR